MKIHERDRPGISWTTLFPSYYSCDEPTLTHKKLRRFWILEIGYLELKMHFTRSVSKLYTAGTLQQLLISNSVDRILPLKGDS